MHPILRPPNPHSNFFISFAPLTSGRWLERWAEAERCSIATAATIAGAAGGAIAGREDERRVRKGDDLFKIFVRMDDGSYQAVAQETQPYLRPGDRVRVENGVVTPI